MKKAILKILFILSFVPIMYIIYLLIEVYFNGIGTGTSSFGPIYNFEAVRFIFKMLFGLNGVCFITIPILTICLTYQIFYIKNLGRNKKCKKDYKNF